MKLGHHITISTGISAVVYHLSGSLGLTLVSFLSGILMDLDHVVDYALHHGRKFDIRDFFSFFAEERYKRLMLIFHGWEWLIGLLFLSWLTKWNVLITGIFIGFSQHLLMDKLYNISRFSSYSFFYRLSVGFRPDLLYLRNRKR